MGAEVIRYLRVSNANFSLEDHLNTDSALVKLTQNTEVNSLRYSRTGVVASMLVWKASANLWEMVDEVRISIGGGGSRPVAKIQSPSSMEMGSSSESMVLSLELSSES